MLISKRIQGSVIRSFLVFHKVQQPGTNTLVTTGFGDVYESSKNTVMGDYSNNIASANYNVNGVDPAATRVYGISYFVFYSQAAFQNIISIGTSNGVDTAFTKRTNLDTYGGFSNAYQFYGNYKVASATPPPTSCPDGCTCTSNVCTACL